VRLITLPTSTTGRILVEDPAGSVSRGLLVGCHGYGQNATDMLEELRRIPGANEWTLASVQALNRFYTRNDQAVVASWMTREDREYAIADNIEYLNRVVSKLAGDTETAGGGRRVAERRIVYLGFSQGASMAARAAVRGATPASGLIMLGGDIPPDLREEASLRWPPVLIGAGRDDKWYGARIDSDVQFLESRGVRHEVVRFAGSHEFTEEFRNKAGDWLRSVKTVDPDFA
jgi:predicted esterase